MENDKSIIDKIDKKYDNLSEYEYFKLLYSDEIVDLLVEESNNYYTKLLIDKYGNNFKDIIINKNIRNTYPFLYVTKGISREDIIAFIGIRIYMGVHKLPSYNQYWDTGLHRNIVKTIMTRNYFLFLAKALHFPEKENENDKEKDKDKQKELNSENEHEISSDNSIIRIDPRHKINLYLEKLAKNFQKYYELGKNITIDESLLQFSGKSSMKYYIPMKPHKYGFKIHCLCDSDTNYLYNMLFDPGKIGKDFMYFEDNSSLTESIVLKLLSCIKDKKQRNIFCDGWYSSISLMKKLTNMGYLNTTILRANSKEVPQKLKMKGYDKAFNDDILIQKYEGKKTFLLATNYQIEKEELRNIYNIKNRGVDTFDHYLELSTIQRRSNKWYKKVILFGVDAAIINSKIICQLKTGKSYTSTKYKDKIIEQIFRMYNDYKKRVSDKNNMKKCIPNNFNAHNIGNIKNNYRKCLKCQKSTSYICISCNINLHPECFIDYHNKHVFK